MNKILKSTFYFFLLLLQINEVTAQEQIDHYIIGRLLNLPKSVSSFQLNENKLFNSSEGYYQKDIRTLRFNTLMIDSILVSSIYSTKGKITFKYDELSRISSFIISQLHDGAWKYESRVTNEFDTLGNKSSTLHELWNDNVWKNDLSEVFINDSLGNNIIHLIKSYNDNNWVNGIKVTNTYDHKKYITKSLTEVWEDTVWINSTRLSWEYLSNGIKSSMFIENWQSNDWENLLFTTFNYNSNNLLMSTFSKIWDVDCWINYARLTFTYNQTEPQTVGLIEAWLDEKWTKYDRYSYSYDKYNYFTHGYYEYFINNEWVPGDGNVHLSNPDGFELHFLTNEMQVFYNGITDIEKDVDPIKYELSQNYPNPFNPTTKINYSIPAIGNVILKVYDVLGREIVELVNEVKESGNYQVTFNGSNLNSGVYFYTIQAGQFKETKKLLLVK